MGKSVLMMFDKHAHYWKSSKVTNGKVGYIATAGNAISMMTRNADNSNLVCVIKLLENI